MITMNEGVGYSSRTKAAHILPTGGNADAKKITSPVERDSSVSQKYADWGNNNDLPIKMAKDIEECGVLNAALDAKADEIRKKLYGPGNTTQSL